MTKRILLLAPTLALAGCMDPDAPSRCSLAVNLEPAHPRLGVDVALPR